jgi:mono/diheme cytochrome c family protein
MRMQRRFKTFFAKWGGLVISVLIVVPAAYFGGTYLYASSRVEATLAWVTQDVNVGNAFLSNPVSKQVEPPQSTYRLVLQVNNRMADVADLTVSGLAVKLNEFDFAVTEYGPWQQQIDPGGTVTFAGDFILAADTIARLTAANRVNYAISGTITATARYSWVKKGRSEKIELSSDAVFLQVTTAPATTAPATTAPPITTAAGTTSPATTTTKPIATSTAVTAAPTATFQTAGAVAQAGQAVFSAKCASCHGATGQGASAPKLIGSGQALAKYGTAQGLLARISTTMPTSAPGSLSHEQYLQLTAYLLVQNVYLATGTAFDESGLGSIPIK